MNLYFAVDQLSGIMNLEARKVNLINWISSVQEPDLIEKLEALQKEGSDWGGSGEQRGYAGHRRGAGTA